MNQSGHLGWLTPSPRHGNDVAFKVFETLINTVHRRRLHHPAIGQILAGERTITPGMARRLSSYFGMSAEFWLNAQSHYDLRKLEREASERPKIELCGALKAGAKRPLKAA